MSTIFDADENNSFGTLKFKGKQYGLTYPSMEQLDTFEKASAEKQNAKDSDGGLNCYYDLLEVMGIPKEVCPKLPTNILFGVAKKIREEMSGKK